jgi:hypothetical protein
MLPHLASRLFGTPLLIQQAKLEAILAALGSRLGLDPLPPTPPTLAVSAERLPSPAPTALVQFNYYITS